jgi:glycyl-tRNA synthetase beta subunit
MVNDDNADIRQNRLNLLQALLDKMRQAAAFELIE